MVPEQRQGRAGGDRDPEERRDDPSEVQPIPEPENAVGP